MGSGSTVPDASNEVIRGQSTIRDLLTYVLTFPTRVTGAGRILGRHKDISFQCFTVTLVVTWTTLTWIGIHRPFDRRQKSCKFWHG